MGELPRGQADVSGVAGAEAWLPAGAPCATAATPRKRSKAR